MRLREPFKRKHVHTWKLVDVKYFVNEHCKLVRSCVDCSHNQLAVVPVLMVQAAARDVPQSLWAYVDLPWQDEPKFPAAGAS